VIFNFEQWIIKVRKKTSKMVHFWAQLILMRPKVIKARFFPKTNLVIGSTSQKLQHNVYKSKNKIFHFGWWYVKVHQKYRLKVHFFPTAIFTWSQLVQKKLFHKNIFSFEKNLAILPRKAISTENTTFNISLWILKVDKKNHVFLSKINRKLHFLRNSQNC